MKKEMLFCDGCDVTTPADNPSGIWTTIKHNLTEYHLCSQECLKGWAIEHLSLPANPIGTPQDKPACKARRFLLVDESANIVEGVKWSDGSVTLDGGAPSYETWDFLKRKRDGWGVQWIDQEVAE